MKPYYEHGGITIYHGDCIEVMQGLGPGRFSCFVTDPPYTATGSSTNGRTSDADGQFFAFWFRAVCAELRRVTRKDGCGFIFCDWRTIGTVQAEMRTPGEHQSADTWSVTQALCWDREGMGMGAPFRNSYEMIAFARGGLWRADHLPKTITTVVRYRWFYGSKDHHGAEKPVPLVRQLIEWCGPGDTVLDPFVGSGTTLLAARLLGRRCVGIERDERYCEIAAQRLSQEVLPFGEVA